MVLRRLAMLPLLALAGCAMRHETPKSKQPFAVAIVCVADRADAREIAPCPPAVLDRATVALAARNLRPRALAADEMRERFESRRTTPQRLDALADAATDADLFVLIETDATFYSQMSGRYRWSVEAKVTLAHKGELDQATTNALDWGIFLDYENQRAPDAIAQAAPRIADEVGRLADDVLGLQ